MIGCHFLPFDFRFETLASRRFQHLEARTAFSYLSFLMGGAHLFIEEYGPLKEGGVEDNAGSSLFRRYEFIPPSLRILG
jgi:hypothetical protein